MMDIDAMLGICGYKKIEEYVVLNSGTYVLDLHPNTGRVIVFKSALLEGDDIGEFGIYFGNPDAAWLPAIRDFAPGGAGVFGWDNLWKVVTSSDLLRVQFSKQTSTGYMYLNIEYYVFDSDIFDRIKETLRKYLEGEAQAPTPIAPAPTPAPARVIRRIT